MKTQLQILLSIRANILFSASCSVSFLLLLLFVCACERVSSWQSRKVLIERRFVVTFFSFCSNCPIVVFVLNLFLWVLFYQYSMGAVCRVWCVSWRCCLLLICFPFTNVCWLHIHMCWSMFDTAVGSRIASHKSRCRYWMWQMTSGNVRRREHEEVSEWMRVSNEHERRGGERERDFRTTLCCKSKYF